MSRKLKDYFPMIWEQESLIQVIRANERLSAQFFKWEESQRETFLNYCTGMQGLKILYDPFFKEITNPEYTPERLNSFLSEVLRRKVKVKTVLPNDSTRIADENSLLITDVVVEMENGSLANVEVQKIGYMFPGERSACYSADTELQLNLLQKYVFIPLDIFKKRPQNKVIRNKLEAWLTFFSAYNPEEIMHLIESYPEFRPMYQQVYNICRNLEEIMGLFSEELQMLDRNTVQLMIDEMQDTINLQAKNLSTKDSVIFQKDLELSRNKEEILQKDSIIQQQRDELEKALKRIQELETSS